MQHAVRLEMTAQPAFASDESGRITLWNEQASRLLGYRAEEVVGRSCWDVIRGTDRYSNQYCLERCNPRKMIARHGPVHEFELDVPTAGGERVRIAFSVVVVSGPSQSRHTLVHLMRLVASARTEAPSGERDRSRGSAPEAGTSPGPEENAPSLSKRETEVLRLVSQGRTTARIAKDLSLSTATVRTHVQNILRKLEAHSKLEAVAVARRKRLL